jgi:hypothetical protein
MTLALRSIFRALFVDDATPSIFAVLIPSRSEKSHSIRTMQPSAASLADAGGPAAKGNARVS